MIIRGLIALVLICMPLSLPAFAEASKDQTSWDFTTGFDGWHTAIEARPGSDQSGIKPVEDAVKWYDRWGGAQGVIVIDACDWKERNIDWNGELYINDVILPITAKTLTVNLVKADHDGGVNFQLVDPADPVQSRHELGQVILTGPEQRQVSYDISKWAGKSINLVVTAIGAGTDMNGCTTPTCCWEYAGVDSVRITGDEPKVSTVNQQPVVISMSADKPSPQRFGTTITWTVWAKDPENDPIIYRFFLNGRPMTDWKMDNTWIWITTEANVRDNQVDVWINDGKHTATDGFDDRKIASFAITA